MRSRDVCVWVCLVAGVPAIASGQGRQGGNNADAREAEKASRALTAQRLQTLRTAFEVLDGPVVTEAPFSAEAITTVTQVLGDGTRIEQTTTARFFRDRGGRVRREQTIAGLGALNGRGNAETITIDPDPGDATAYTLDPATRTARRAPRIVFSSVTLGPAIRLNSGAVMLNGDPVAARPVWRATAEQLGTRQFDGVKAVGRKSTSVIPTGDIGNDRPIEITDERWESPELRMLVYSRTSDPRTGVVEYRLTNINRSEPPADLFTIPADYTVVEPSEPGARGAGGRGAGGFGRGGRGN
jgi:hypothetical protein